jgi:formate dehydrogenase maturation protein FdhE
MGSHPAFYKFITTLNGLILANDIDIERMENGVSVCQNKKDCGADKNKRILNFTRKLENGECSPLQFVEGIAHLQKSKVTVSAIERPDYDSESDNSSDDEEQIKNQQEAQNVQNDDRQSFCPVCLSKPLKLVFLWGHFVSTSCSETLRERHQHAPLAEHPLQISSGFIILNLKRPE